MTPLAKVSQASASSVSPLTDARAVGRHRLHRRTGERQHQVDIVDHQVEDHVDIGRTAAPRRSGARRRCGGDRRGAAPARQPPARSARCARPGGRRRPRSARADEVLGAAPSTASGFSMKTCTPASMKSPATAWWSVAGTAIDTASTLPISARWSVNASAPVSAAIASARARIGIRHGHQPRRRMPHNGGHDAARKRRVPTTPTLMPSPPVTLHSTPAPCAPRISAGTLDARVRARP